MSKCVHKKTIAKQSIKKKKSEENIHGTAEDLKQGAVKGQLSHIQITLISLQNERDAKDRWRLILVATKQKQEAKY